MKTQNSFSTTNSNTLSRRARTACAARLLPLILLLTASAVAQAQDDDYAYTATNGTITITVYIGYGGDVTIPDTIDGLPVTSIGDEAFSAYYWDRAGLTSVMIPDSVISIGDWAFEGCTDLTNAVIGNSVTNIGDYAFAFCDSLTAITVATNNPAYRSVAGVLFNKSTSTLIQCPGGKAGSYAVPNGVTSIGNEAFDECLGLTSVTIPNSVTNIGDDAFYYCTNLTSVMIGNSVTSIGDDAFAACFSLTSITIPNSVLSIGYWAFEDCGSLTNAVIGNSVTNIGDEAFAGCWNLTRVYFLGNAPTIGSDVFYNDWLTVFYLQGTKGWNSPTFGDCPAVQRNRHFQVSDDSFGVRTNRFGFNITGTSGLVIVVEACTNLANPTWSPVGTNNLTGGFTTGSCYFNDPDWTNYPTRFYRLRSPRGVGAAACLGTDRKST